MNKAQEPLQEQVTALEKRLKEVVRFCERLQDDQFDQFTQFRNTQYWYDDQNHLRFKELKKDIFLNKPKEEVVIKDD